MSTTLSACSAALARSRPCSGTVTWKSPFVVWLGAALLVATALGPIAADLGPASLFVWGITTLSRSCSA